MAIIDVVKYDGPQGLLAWKYPSQELGTWTQLVVNESQEALFFKGGQAMDLFTAGTHTLSTNNIPLLNHLINLPFGGRSPFTAEVWYVNKLHILDVKWGTRDPMQLQDPQYKIIIPVRSFGQFGIQIDDTRKFIVKLVGTIANIDKDTLVQYFKGLLTTKIKDLISGYLVHKKISILEINAYMDEISVHMQEQITPVFDEYGIKIVNFFVNSINFPEDDKAVQHLRYALAKRAEMDIIGYNYQQERSFDTLEAAANNESNGGLMNAGIGLGMGVGIGGNVGNVVGQMAEKIDVKTSDSLSKKTCPDCSAACDPDAKFCFNCGFEFKIPEKNVESYVTCTKCNQQVPANSKFCPNCGTSLNKKCPNCDKENGLGAKFCSECGTTL